MLAFKFHSNRSIKLFIYFLTLIGINDKNGIKKIYDVPTRVRYLKIYMLFNTELCNSIINLILVTLCSVAFTFIYNDSHAKLYTFFT